MKIKLICCIVASVILCCAIAVSFAYAAQVESITVEPNQWYELTYNLDTGQTYSGSISVTGGSGNDVNFWVTNPQGSTVLNSGKVSGGTTFEFTAQSSGAYTLHFDNTFSVFSSKSVYLTYDITTPLGGLGGDSGSGLLLILGGIAILIVIVIVVVIAFSRRNRGSAPNQNLPPPPPPQ